MTKQLEQKLDSREVAEMVGKEHHKLLRDIRSYVEQLGESKIGYTDFFQESTYRTTQNKEMPCYLVTKKGCEFIAHKLTGIKGTEFTAKYINRFHQMEEQISEPRRLSVSEQIQLSALGNGELEERVTNLENNMTLDYAQQQSIGKAVNKAVIKALGRKNSNAYHKIGKKVFSECNRDIKDYFCINARNNIPRVRFQDAMSYIEHWQPSTNTRIMIEDCNAQLRM
ncbi:MAG: ORF6C domain-containing protein [Clostridiales bacterium]|nr:ORF6C domain-containing protein [Clostridiales bacterium]